MPVQTFLVVPQLWRWGCKLSIWSAVKIFVVVWSMPCSSPKCCSTAPRLLWDWKAQG